MPSGESPSGDSRVKGPRGEGRGLYQILVPAYCVTKLNADFPSNGTSSNVQVVWPSPPQPLGAGALIP